MRNFIAALAMSVGVFGVTYAAETPPVETPQNTSVQPADQAQGTVVDRPTATTPKNANAKPSATPQTGAIVDPKNGNAKPATDPKKPGEKGANATPPASEEPPRMTEALKPSEGSQGPQLDPNSSSPRLVAGEQHDTTPRIKVVPEELNQRTDTTATKKDTEVKKDNPIR